MSITSTPESTSLELPVPDADAMRQSQRLAEAIIERMEQQGGAIGFDEYMSMALYQPGLGYYSAGAIKFGESGDFVTAPEISPLFGFCLARQVEGLVSQGCAPRILEFGAGSGKLCAQILSSYSQLQRYLILDLSADLKQRQQQYLQQHLAPELFAKIEWLSNLPTAFDGVVIANEVLDAMPLHRIEYQPGWCESGVCFENERFQWCPLPVSDRVGACIKQLESSLGEFEAGYRSEINLQLGPWFAALGDCCRQAIVLIIDYGYEQHEYYHPVRYAGTLVCHYQHRAHHDPLIYPGLQDITAFVDFDAAADAAVAAGFDAIGLVSQNRFLLANQLLEEADRRSAAGDAISAVEIAQQVKMLSLPQEMGEKFKVLALQKNLTLDMPAMSRSGIYG